MNVEVQLGLSEVHSAQKVTVSSFVRGTDALRLGPDLEAYWREGRVGVNVVMCRHCSAVIEHRTEQRGFTGIFRSSAKGPRYLAFVECLLWITNARCAHA